MLHNTYDDDYTNEPLPNPTVRSYNYELPSRRNGRRKTQFYQEFQEFQNGDTTIATTTTHNK